MRGTEKNLREKYDKPSSWRGLCFVRGIETPEQTIARQALEIEALKETNRLLEAMGRSYSRRCPSYLEYWSSCGQITYLAQL
jgi:hypothetical protein